MLISFHTQQNGNVKNVILYNIRKHVESFMYPLFYLKETFGYHVDLQLSTPNMNNQHVTQLELLQYQIIVIQLKLDRCLT